MKKKSLVAITLVVAVCLIAAVCLVGCGGEGDGATDINAHLKNNEVYKAVSSKMNAINNKGNCVISMTSETSYSAYNPQIQGYETNTTIIVVGGKQYGEKYMLSTNQTENSTTTENTTYAYKQGGKFYSALVTTVNDGEANITKLEMPSPEAFAQQNGLSANVFDTVKFNYDEETKSISGKIKTEVSGMAVEGSYVFSLEGENVKCVSVVNMSMNNPDDPEHPIKTTTASTMTYSNIGTTSDFEIPQNVLDAPLVQYN